VKSSITGLASSFEHISSTRRLGARPGDLELEHLAHPQGLDLGEAQAVQRPLHGGALDIENARLEVY
jgi:hypothetical protein